MQYIGELFDGIKNKMESSCGSAKKWRALSEARLTHKLGAIQSATPHTISNIKLFDLNKLDSQNDNTSSNFNKSPSPISRPKSHTPEVAELAVVLPNVKHSHRTNTFHQAFLTSDCASASPEIPDVSSNLKQGVTIFLMAEQIRKLDRT